MLVMFVDVGLENEDDDVQQEFTMGSLVIFTLFEDAGEIDNSVRFAFSDCSSSA